MSITEMRERVAYAYQHSISWQEKVKKMPDKQVVAIYYDFKRRNKV